MVNLNVTVHRADLSRWGQVCYPIRLQKPCRSGQGDASLSWRILHRGLFTVPYFIEHAEYLPGYQSLTFSVLEHVRASCRNSLWTHFSPSVCTRSRDSHASSTAPGMQYLSRLVPAVRSLLHPYCNSTRSTMASKSKQNLTLALHRYVTPRSHYIDQETLVARLEAAGRSIALNAKVNPCCGHCWEPLDVHHPSVLECPRPCGACGSIDHNGNVSWLTLTPISHLANPCSIAIVSI
jgi:hypothetical protein